jgi:hypothetical protein
LAHIPAFSVAFWLTTDLANFRPGPGKRPGISYGNYVVEGFLKKVDTSVVGNGPTPHMNAALGSGERDPYMRGMTANTRNTMIHTAKHLPI